MDAAVAFLDKNTVSTTIRMPVPVRALSTHNFPLHPKSEPTFFNSQPQNPSLVFPTKMTQYQPFLTVTPDFVPMLNSKSFFYRAVFPPLIPSRPVLPQTPTRIFQNVWRPVYPASIPVFPAQLSPLIPQEKAAPVQAAAMGPTPPPEPEKSESSSKVEHVTYGTTTAYKRRNVYKSIIRNMNSFIYKHDKELTKILLESGFAQPEINECFQKVGQWSNLEKRAGTSKKSQAMVEKLLSKTHIATYILKEALKAMIDKWENGRVGRISSHNIAIYKETCEKYYQRTIELTDGPAKLVI